MPKVTKCPSTTKCPKSKCPNDILSKYDKMPKVTKCPKDIMPKMTKCPKCHFAQSDKMPYHIVPGYSLQMIWWIILWYHLLLKTREDVRNLFLRKQSRQGGFTIEKLKKWNFLAYVRKIFGATPSPLPTSITLLKTSNCPKWMHM